jgi:hypothetical protein
MQLIVVVIGLVLGVVAFGLGVATDNLGWYAAGVVLFAVGTAASVGLGPNRPRT